MRSNAPVISSNINSYYGSLPALSYLHVLCRYNVQHDILAIFILYGDKLSYGLPDPTAPCGSLMSAYSLSLTSLAPDTLFSGPWHRTHFWSFVMRTWGALDWIICPYETTEVFPLRHSYRPLIKFSRMTMNFWEWWIVGSSWPVVKLEGDAETCGGKVGNPLFYHFLKYIQVPFYVTANTHIGFNSTASVLSNLNKWVSTGRYFFVQMI
jgi:hypothetical protein